MHVNTFANLGVVNFGSNYLHEQQHQVYWQHYSLYNTSSDTITSYIDEAWGQLNMHVVSLLSQCGGEPELTCVSRVYTVLAYSTLH